MAERAGGHLRFENALIEAIISAPFNGAQVKIVLATYRLTVGWQRQTVKLTLEQLAQACGYETASGGFREQRRGLLDAGVLGFVPDGAGRGASGTYRLEVDPSRWGEFTPTEAVLQRTWGTRPDHNDDQLPLRILHVESGSPIDESLPVKRQATDESLPAKGQASRLNTGRHLAPLQAGKGDSTAATASSSEAGKTLKDRKDNYPPQPQRRGRGDAMQLLTAIEALKETTTTEPRREYIRRDRIRTELGADVEEALKLCGGVDRLLTGKAAYRGVLIAQFTDALNHVRGRIRTEATEATA